MRTGNRGTDDDAAQKQYDEFQALATAVYNSCVLAVEQDRKKAKSKAKAKAAQNFGLGNPAKIEHSNALRREIKLWLKIYTVYLSPRRGLDAAKALIYRSTLPADRTEAIGWLKKSDGSPYELKYLAQILPKLIKEVQRERAKK